MTTEKRKTPLLDISLSVMPAGIRKTISSEPIIPAIAGKATAITQQNPEFIRSDQGQILDVFPDKEIRYGPSA
jgi:hypothetical protein